MTYATPDALIAACTLAAAHEAARRIRQGETLTDIPRYVRTRTERMVRDHAALWATLPDPDPIDFARAIEPAGGTTQAPATVRTLDDGTQQRFLPGTGWATIHEHRAHDGHLVATSLELATSSVWRDQIAESERRERDGELGPLTTIAEARARRANINAARQHLTDTPPTPEPR